MIPRPTLGTVLDSLDLGADRWLLVTAGPDGMAAVPAVRDIRGGLRRAAPGDGAAEALVAMLATVRGFGDRGQIHGAVLDHARRAGGAVRSPSTRPTNR